MRTEYNVESSEFVSVFYNGINICKAYNIREMTREEGGTYYVYDVVRAPKGVSEEVLDRQIKFNLLESLCIEYNDAIYQADPLSRNNMIVKVLEDNTTPFAWKLKDNTFKDITTQDLKAILSLAMQDVQSIIGDGHENK